MNTLINGLSQEERLPLALRALYRQYGYRIYKLADFEPYDLYHENKSFLAGSNIITFTDVSGKLMTLKPDVTISIAKDIKPEETCRKLFYLEHVFRRQKGSDQYREIKQMGLEYIGADSGYAQAEVISLALLTLAAISEDYVLGLSHMGFVSALLDHPAINGVLQEQLLNALRQKSANEMAALLADVPIPAAQRDAILEMTMLSGDIASALPRLHAICQNDIMRAAVNELEELASVLARLDMAGHVQVDMSLINDLDYYNGVVFRGYIRHIPYAVLAGGRYDNLLRRFGKPQQALGFGLYMNEINEALHRQAPYDVDTLLVYGNAKAADVAAAVQQLLETCPSVRAEKTVPAGLRARQTLNIEELL